MKRTIFSLLLVFLGTPFICQPITAQFTIDGNVQNFNALGTYSNNELITARNRLDIRLKRSFTFGDFHSETHLYNYYQDSFDFELMFREIYLDYFTTNYDIRIGLQRLTTGRSDAGFVTDIYSGIDYRDFLTKEPEEIVLGTMAINIRRYFNQNSIQLILNPFRNRSRLPDSGSRWFPVQSIDAPIPVDLRRDEQNYSLTHLNSSLNYAHRSIPNMDFDINLLYWNYPAPSLGIRLNNGNNLQNAEFELFETYQQSFMVGLSGLYQISSRLFLTSETLFVQNRLFTFTTLPVDLLENAFEDVLSAIQFLNQFENRDDNYLMGKPWIHTMAGLQTDLFGFTLSSQFYLEWILDYDQNILAQQFFPYATFRLSRLLNRDRLQLTALNRYNFAGNDWLLQFQGTYEMTDGLEFTIGTNLMGGDQIDPFYGHFSFNQYRDNSFIFTRITYYF